MFKEDCAKKTEGVRLVAFLVMGFIGFLTLHLISTAVVHSGATGPQRQVQNRRPKKAVKPAAQKKPRVDYSRFSHHIHVTQEKLLCDSCHKFPTKNWKEVRKGDTAFPDVAEFPEHSSCLNCHRQHFFARERPAPAICSNCHVNATPRDTTRFLFPSLGDVIDPTLKTREFISEFGVGFPHDKHLDVVGPTGQLSGRMRLRSSSLPRGRAPSKSNLNNQRVVPSAIKPISSRAIQVKNM